MDSFESRLQQAIDQGVVANAVLEARRTDPAYAYTKSFGRLTLSPNAAPLQPDAIFWLASCTKLLTSIAALQCVSRGLVTLDSPISSILPEFAHPSIVTGFDPSTKAPILHAAKNPITLRQLLTHTSGMAYPFSSPLLASWRAIHPLPSPKRDILKEYVMPLVFEPGAPGKWTYSVGLDWAGKMVERLNGGMTLGAYMEAHIFEPLGIRDMTFRPLQRSDLLDRMCPRIERRADGSLAMDPMEAYPIIEPVDDAGGGGLYGAAGEYVKILESLLRDDGKLLDSSRLQELFQSQLPDCEELQKRLNATGPGRVMNGYGERQVRLNHGLGGLLAVDGVPGEVGKGMLCWDGLPSCFWWVDRERGTCGFYGSQIFPAGDQKTAELSGEFRKAVYNEHGGSCRGSRQE